MKKSYNFLSFKYAIKISLITSIILLIVAFTWYFFSTTPHYNIIPINSYDEIINSINYCTPKTLITFDVDDTLITTHDPLLITLKYPLLFKIQAIISYPKLLSKNYFELVASIVFSHAHFFLTEQNIISIIKQLQNNNCNIIGLTSIETGTFGIISSFEEWRAQMLHDFGINFNNVFNESIIFDKLPQYRGNYPHFFKGIMCTNQQPKGTALQALLEKKHLSQNLLFHLMMTQMHSNLLLVHAQTSILHLSVINIMVQKK